MILELVVALVVVTAAVNVWSSYTVRRAVERMCAMTHELVQIEERIESGPLGTLGGMEWRWRCSCGAVGHWTGQSDGAARAGHARHARRASA